MERPGHRAAGERGVLRARRSYRQLPVRGHPVRRGLPAFLPGRIRRPWRRPAVHPGAFVAGHLRPLVRGGPAHRGAADEVPAGDRRRRPVLLPAPVADAGVLADAHGVDGPGPDHGDLPGALPEVPGLPRAGRHRGPEGLGVPRRRGDRRAGVAGRHRAGQPGEARQPHLRGQLQPAAAGRPGPRQRQDHPGARGHLPRRGLERDQDDLGQRLGPAHRPRLHRPAAEADGGMRRRRVPGLQVQERRVRPGEVLRQVPGAARDGRGDDRRRDLGAEPRRPRPAQDLRRVLGRDADDRPAHRHPGQDHQGLRDGGIGRGPEHHPPAEAHGRRGPGQVPGPVQPAADRRAAGRAAVPALRRRQRGDGLPAGAAGGPRRVPAFSPEAVDAHADGA